MNSNQNYYQNYPPEQNLNQEQFHHPNLNLDNNYQESYNQQNVIGQSGNLPSGAGSGDGKFPQYSNSERNERRVEEIKQPNAFRELMNSLATRNQLLFIFTLTVQGIVALTMIGLIYATINSAIGENVSASDTFLTDPKLETVATYLSIFILAVLFELLVSLDALLQKNILQIGLLLIFQIALLAYAAVLPHQLFNAIVGSNADTPRAQDYVRAYAIVIPAVIGIITSVMTCLTWLLYTDFGWEVFKRIGADIKLKKMYQLYQVYVCLLKFDGFFLLGFEIQFLVLVSGTPTAEFVLTIAALPITLVCLVSAAFVVRMESRRGVYAFFVLQFFGLAYFFYKLVRIFDSSSGDRYKTAQASLTIFSIASILLLLLTFIVTGLCYANFGQGLRQNIPPYLYSKRSRNTANNSGRQDGQGEKLNGDRSSVRMSLD